MQGTEELDGERVLARIDVNSPVEDGQVRDNKRFEKHAETMQDLLERGNAVAILAHQGRPGRDTYVSLKQHAEILSSYLDREVEHVDETVGEEALEAVEDLEKGEVLMLENVRFLDEELENLPPKQHSESGLVETLEPHFESYVNDAFSAAHRSHASLVGFPPVMDSYAGPVMEEEWENNTALRNGLDGKVTMLVGGKKAGDVVRVMEDMAEEVDDFLVAGLIGELFLRAEGYDVGFDVRSEDDLMHELWMDNRDAVKRLLDENGEKIHLPEDLAFHNGGMMREEVLVEEAAKQKPYWDIGRRTVEKFRPYLEDADAVFVKGAPGVFEDEKFRYGTAELLETLASRRSFTVVGGGDTARAVDLCGLEDSDFDHVSIAGGAYIRALTGEELPAIETLKNHPNE